MKQASEWQEEIFERFNRKSPISMLKSITNEVIARAQLEALKEGRSQNANCDCRVQDFSDELAKVNEELHSLGIPWVDGEGKMIPTTVDRLRVLVKGYKSRLEQANDHADEADRHYRYLMTIIGGVLQGAAIPRKEDEPEVNELLEAIRKVQIHKIVDVDFEVDPIEGAWWMVFNPYPRGRKPEIRHPSKDVAIEEAKRLAAKEGNKFHVLEKVFTAQPPPPKPTQVVDGPTWCDHIKWGKHQQGDQIYEMDWTISMGEGFCARVPQGWVHCPVNHCNAERPF